MIELSSNKIQVIEGLENLPSMQEVYLNKNRITEIRGLEPVSQITVLGLTVRNSSIVFFSQQKSFGETNAFVVQ